MKKVLLVILAMSLISISAFASPLDAVKRVGHGVKVGITAPFKGFHKLFTKSAHKPTAAKSAKKA